MSKLFRRGQHVARDEPTQPLYADHKVLGLTLTFRAKLAILLTGVVLVLLFASLLSFEAVVNSRHDQTRKLACLLVSRIRPGDVQADQIRSEWNCPPYTPPTPSASPSALPSAQALAPTVPPSSSASSAAQPSAGTSGHPGTSEPAQTHSAPRPTPTPTPASTKTVTAPPVATTTTAHATATATVTKPPATVTASPTGLCAVSPLLCGLLGG